MDASKVLVRTFRSESSLQFSRFPFPLLRAGRMPAISERAFDTDFPDDDPVRPCAVFFTVSSSVIGRRWSNLAPASNVS